MEKFVPGFGADCRRFSTGGMGKMRSATTTAAAVMLAGGYPGAGQWRRAGKTTRHDGRFPALQARGAGRRPCADPAYRRVSGDVSLSVKAGAGPIGADSDFRSVHAGTNSESVAISKPAG